MKNRKAVERDFQIQGEFGSLRTLLTAAKKVFGVESPVETWVSLGNGRGGETATLRERDQSGVIIKEPVVRISTVDGRDYSVHVNPSFPLTDLQISNLRAVLVRKP